MFLKLMARVAGQLEEGLPFVVYRKPKEEGIKAIFQNDAQLHHIFDFSETGFILAPFRSNTAPVLLKADEQLEATHTGKENHGTEAHMVPQIDSSQKEFHIDLVKKGIAKIQNTEVKKIVLSRCLQIDRNTDPFELFQSLLTNYPNAFCYLWYHPKVGMWLGATPEILLRLENGQLTTMSLAGTQIHKQRTDLVWGKKEREEQALVTGFISKALESKVSNLTISDLESVRAGNLWHLRTKLSGGVQGNLSEIIRALHPTPAVCGLPTTEALQFILDHENYDREYYTGYLGELNLRRNISRTSSSRNQENMAYRSVKATTELFVNLRCMKLSEGKAFIFVGGGVTADSDPLKEWEETVNKSFTMLKVLGSV